LKAASNILAEINFNISAVDPTTPFPYKLFSMAMSNISPGTFELSELHL